MTETYVSKSVAETLAFAEKFSECLRPGDVVAFCGDLGAGKTLFVKGLAKGLGLVDADEVKSPTFAIMHIYEAKYPLYHYDLYRLETNEELEAIGLDEFLDDPKAICCIEWSERANAFLPQPAYRVQIELIDEKQRKITVNKVVGKNV
jgi:tRNA threonylcarbamoyladenosine biosynthesis protein TsaE